MSTLRANSTAWALDMNRGARRFRRGGRGRGLDRSRNGFFFDRALARRMEVRRDLRERLQATEIARGSRVGGSGLRRASSEVW